MTFIYNCWKVFLTFIYNYWKVLTLTHNHLFDIQCNATAFMLNQLSFFFSHQNFPSKGEISFSVKNLLNELQFV